MNLRSIKLTRNGMQTLHNIGHDNYCHMNSFQQFLTLNTNYHPCLFTFIHVVHLPYVCVCLCMYVVCVVRSTWTLHSIMKHRTALVLTYRTIYIIGNSKIALLSTGYILTSSQAKLCRTETREPIPKQECVFTFKKRRWKKRQSHQWMTERWVSYGLGFCNCIQTKGMKYMNIVSSHARTHAQL